MFLCVQVPEQDEMYEEDSFVVDGSEVEEDFDSASDDEEEAEIEIVPEDSFVDGRRQYTTRRRARLRQTRTSGETRTLQSRTTKRSRIVQVEDSSEEEEEKDEKKRKMLYARKAPVSDTAPGTVFNTACPPSHSPKSDPARAGGEKSRKGAVPQKQETDRQRFSNQALLSEELDFQEPLPITCVKTQVRVLEGRCQFL